MTGIKGGYYNPKNPCGNLTSVISKGNSVQLGGLWSEQSEKGIYFRFKANRDFTIKEGETLFVNINSSEMRVLLYDRRTFII